MKWIYVKRRYNGMLRRVKVHRKTNGGYLVRVTHYRNRHD